MKKKYLFLFMAVGVIVATAFAGCQKKGDVQIETEEQPVISEEVQYENSVLYGKSYEMQFIPARGQWDKGYVGYKKYVNGKEYLYEPRSEDGFFTETVYCNGTDVFVYTDKVGSVTLDGKVWVTGMENPYEAIEKDIYAVTMEEVEPTNETLDKTPFFRSLGFTNMEMLTKGTVIHRTEKGFSVPPIGMFGGGNDVSLEIMENSGSLEVPKIDQVHDISEYLSETELTTGKTLTEAQEKREVNGYYYADGTYGYSEVDSQGWEYYEDGVCVKKYDYDTDTLYDYQNGTTEKDYYKNKNDGLPEDIRWAGELLDVCEEFSTSDGRLSWDNTISEVMSACWGAEFESMTKDPSSTFFGAEDTPQEFRERMAEIFSTFTFRYMADNFNDFDTETQAIILGISDVYNLRLEGREESFRDLLVSKGIKVDDVKLLNYFYNRYNGNKTYIGED